MSLTVTVKLQLAEVFRLASVAWHVTVLKPLLNVAPEGLTEPLVAPAEVQVTPTPGQLSAPVTE